MTGRLIYTHDESALAPGYHRIGWDGTDAEGQKIANGLYLYRLVAGDGSSSDRVEGRLIKLRRPRRQSEQTTSTQ